MPTLTRSRSSMSIGPKNIVLTDERKRLNIPAKALPDLDHRSPSDEEIHRVLLDL